MAKNFSNNLIAKALVIQLKKIVLFLNLMADITEKDYGTKIEGDFSVRVYTKSDTGFIDCDTIYKPFIETLYLDESNYNKVRTKLEQAKAEVFASIQNEIVSLDETISSAKIKKISDFLQLITLSNLIK